MGKGVEGEWLNFKSSRNKEKGGLKNSVVCDDERGKQMKVIPFLGDIRTIDRLLWRLKDIGKRRTTMERRKGNLLSQTSGRCWLGRRLGSRILTGRVRRLR